MATVYSAQKTLTDVNNPSEKVKTNELHGRVRMAFGSYEASGLSAGDVIEMFNLPNGARLLSGSIANDALGSSTTLSVGYAAHKTSAGATVALDADAYKAAASTASAGLADILATIVLGNGTEVDADGDGLPITVTLAGAAATGTIQCTMMYVTD